MSPYDQQVYDAGFKYIPQSRFLLNPFQIPQGGGGGGATNPTQPGLPSINIGGGGGGGGFNPYNPDMSQIRTDFNPRAYNLAMRQGNTVGPNPDLFFAPQSKIGGLMDFIPGIGTIRRGAEFLKGLLPINERAIMENEARGMGIFTDDIGRVVAGPGGYNTAQGIMAGYNLNKIDQGTFDKRRATIEKAIERRKASGQDYSGLMEKLGLLEEAEDLYLGPLKTRTDTIYKYRKDKKAKEAAAKAAEKEAKRQEAERVAAFNKARADRAAARKSGLEEAIYTGQDTSKFDRPTSGAYAEGAGMGLQGGYQTDYQGGDTSYSAPSSSVGYSAADDARESRRGRYFMNGGLVDLVDIYD